MADPPIDSGPSDLQTGGDAEQLAQQVAPASDEIPLAEGSRIDTTVAVEARLSDLVGASGLPEFIWSANDPKRRSMAPIGYLEGMARTYARAYCNLKKDPQDPLAQNMATGVAPGANPATDAVAKFAQDFNAFGADVSVDGVDVLRAVFTILFSLGMRESDGKHCTGWDRGKLTGWGDPTKAIAPSATNSEAGLFQISFDIGVGAPGDFQDLYTRYQQAPLSGFLNVFRKGVVCDAAEWGNFGAGDGFDFQQFSKECPAFAVELAALAIRVRANYSGPYNSNKVEIVRPCWDLLLEIESAIDELDGCIAVAM